MMADKSKPDKRVTMIKPVVGKVKSPSYALPDNDFVYGIESKLDKEGAGEVVSSWAQSKSSEPPCSMQSFIFVNRQALKEKQRNIKDAELERQSQEKLRLQKLETKKKKLYGKVKSRAFDPTTNDCCATSDHPPRGSSISTGSHEHNYQIAFGRKVPITDPPRPCSSTDSVASSSDTRHKSYGKVPNYILQRKAKIEQFEQEERTRRENAPPHPGLVLMEESERLETLAMLDANEREAREELRNIPFSMNEQKSARLREAIEYRLKEIEETRNIFQKEKVFLAKED